MEGENIKFGRVKWELRCFLKQGKQGTDTHRTTSDPITLCAHKKTDEYGILQKQHIKKIQKNPQNINLKKRGTSHGENPMGPQARTGAMGELLPSASSVCMVRMSRHKASF